MVTLKRKIIKLLILLYMISKRKNILHFYFNITNQEKLTQRYLLSFLKCFLSEQGQNSWHVYSVEFNTCTLYLTNYHSIFVMIFQNKSNVLFSLWKLLLLFVISLVFYVHEHICCLKLLLSKIKFYEKVSYLSL